MFDGEDKQPELEVKREGEAIKSELPCLRRRQRNVSATPGALSAGLFLLPQRDQLSHSELSAVKASCVFMNKKE